MFEVRCPSTEVKIGNLCSGGPCVALLPCPSRARRCIVFSLNSFVSLCEETKQTQLRTRHSTTTCTTHPRQIDKHSTSWRSDVPPPCLGGCITRVGPGQHAWYTSADLGQEAVGGSTTTARTRWTHKRQAQSVSNKGATTQPWWRSPVANYSGE